MKLIILNWINWTFKNKGFWSRALLCWLIATVLLKFDEIEVYDARFKIRGPQPVSSEIVLINIKPSDFAKLTDASTNSLININESQEITDSFFWDQKLWALLLEKLLKEKPQKIGITLFFGENIGKTRLTLEESLIFRNPQIIWSTNSSQFEKLSLPFASRPDKSNIAHTDVLREEDGVVRRLSENQGYLSKNLLQDLGHKLLEKKESPLPGLLVVNFRGLQVFKKYSLNQILKNEYPKNYFENKIILIGADKSLNAQLNTPLGSMTKTEFWGHVCDNILNQRFVRKLPFSINSLILLILTVISVFIITHFPQVVASIIFIWLTALVSAFSLWVFDTFSIWIPLISPIVLLILVWVIFLGYHALRIEKAHAHLQQTQKNLAELEQLKNNFISLISHDLKTPIAKIQAVLDRLDHQNIIPEPIKDDFNNLKSYSEELNRYIQSILKVLRVESRDFKIIKETADINGVIENVIERLKPLAQSKSIQIKLNLEPIFLIEFDVTLMTEVILNLVENAIKYTPSMGEVKIRTFEANTDIIIEISDTGEGISLEDQSHVWKKFVRGPQQDLKTKGSGLGLYLVKYFIELHRGHVSLTSELNKGSKFKIRLPIDSDPS